MQIKCKIKGCDAMMNLEEKAVNNHYIHHHPRMKATQKTRIMMGIFGDHTGFKEPARSNEERALMKITGAK